MYLGSPLSAIWLPRLHGTHLDENSLAPLLWHTLVPWTVGNPLLLVLLGKVQSIAGE